MLWLYLVIIAQFISAVVFLVDKYLLSANALNRPVVYAFYVGMLSGVVVFILPFGVVTLPTASVVLLSLVTALTYILSVLLLYSALKIADASDVAPVVGAVMAIATLLFSRFFLKTDLPGNFFAGFLFLITGTLLMSAFRFNRLAFVYVVAAGVILGLASVLIKMIFEITTFWNGFFWSRMANVIGALVLLLWPANLKAIVNNFKTAKTSTKFLVLFNKAIAGLAFFLVFIAIKLGDVSVISALNGIQFVFLLILAFILTHKLPQYFHEAVHHQHHIVKKTIAASFIVVGFLILFL